MCAGFAFEEISALSPGDFEDRIGEYEPVGASAGVSEMLSPRQSDRVGGNPAEVTLLGSRVPAPGRHRERNEKLVQHHSVLAKWRADIVPRNLDAPVEDAFGQGVAGICQRPHIEPLPLVCPIEEPPNVCRFETESSVSG